MTPFWNNVRVMKGKCRSELHLVLIPC